MEITATTKTSVKMFYNWAKQRTEQGDKSPFARAIVNDKWFISSLTDSNGVGLCYMIANYWNIQPLKDSKPPQPQHIPTQWMKFMFCVNSGQPFYDEHLHKLLIRVGFPYVDSNNDLKYHYLEETVEGGGEHQLINHRDSNYNLTQQWRGLPHLFPLFCNYEPLVTDLKKHRENYIAQTFFSNFINIMPFLYWAGQAYALAIEHSEPIPIKSLEIDGKFAFTLLFESMTRNKEGRELPAAFFDMVLIIAQALTSGCALEAPQRTPFVNRLLAFLGERKNFEVNSVIEFLLSSDWNLFMTSDINKQTKAAAKKFYTTSAWIKAPVSDSTDSLILIRKGAQIWQDQFVRTTVGFDAMHQYVTTAPDHDGCSIM